MLDNRHSKDRWIRRAVARDLSRDDAVDLETTLTLCYGRKDIGTGILVNKNNGIGRDLRNVSEPAHVSAPTFSALGPVRMTLFLFVLLISLLIIWPLVIRRKPLTATLMSTPAPDRNERSCTPA
jgi:hypothetical protein